MIARGAREHPRARPPCPPVEPPQRHWQEGGAEGLPAEAAKGAVNKSLSLGIERRMMCGRCCRCRVRRRPLPTLGRGHWYSELGNFVLRGENRRVVCLDVAFSLLAMEKCARPFNIHLYKYMCLTRRLSNIGVSTSGEPNACVCTFTVRSRSTAFL